MPDTFERVRIVARHPPLLGGHVTFYLMAGVTVLFLHTWFSLLALGPDSLDGNDSAWIIWAAVNVLVPIVAGVTGCRLWKEAAEG